MSKSRFLDFDKLMAVPWFGLATRDGAMRMSIVSLFGEKLSEANYATLPLAFKEYGASDQIRINSLFRSFFLKYLVGTNFFQEKYKKIIELSLQDIEEHIDSFQNDILNTYVNFDKEIIFCTNFDLEIIIYSKNDFSCNLDDGLFFRTHNEIVKWNETHWYDDFVQPISN